MLVMIAMDRFQAVCYPMTNRVWKPSQSNLKIVAAWTIALVTFTSSTLTKTFVSGPRRLSLFATVFKLTRSLSILEIRN